MKTTAPKTTATLQRQPAPQEQGPFFRKEGQAERAVNGAETATLDAPSNFVSTKRNGSLWGGEPFFQPTLNGNPSAIQPKLTIGQPNDKYEQEADRMAEMVVDRVSRNGHRQGNGKAAVQAKEGQGVQQKPAFESEEEPAKPTVKTKEEEESPEISREEDEQGENVQAKEEVEEVRSREQSIREKPENKAVEKAPAPTVLPKAEAAPPVSGTSPILTSAALPISQLQLREEEELEAPEKEENLQRKPIFESDGDPPDEETGASSDALMAKSEDGQLTGTESLQHQLDSSRDGGEPLPEDTRSEMESVFGADFSEVRTHNDSRAAEMNQGLNAQAFTHGSDIYFNEGKYDPDSNSGKELLAHELTHTVQQGGVYFKSIQGEGHNSIEENERRNLIVEDNIIPANGQMKKSIFINQAKLVLQKILDSVFEGTPYEAENFPYIFQALRSYENRPAEQVETFLQRNIEGADHLTSAQDYIKKISEQVRRIAQNWLETGELPEEPKEIISAIPEQFRLLGRANRYLLPIWRATDNIVNVIQQVGTTAINTLSEVGDQVSGFFSGAAGTVMGLFSKSNSPGGADRQNPFMIVGRLGVGEKLSGEIKGKMETAFQRDFSEVVVHTGPEAGEVSKELGAKAFTVGHQIGFDTNEYRPGTILGDALIAHELAHVVQQENAKFNPDTPSSLVPSERREMEREADQSAVSAIGILWGRTQEVFELMKDWASPETRASFSVQTCDTELITDEEALRTRLRQDGGNAEELMGRYTFEELMYMLDQLQSQIGTYEDVQRDARIITCGGGSIPTANNLIENANQLDQAIINDPSTFTEPIPFEHLELLFLIKFKEKAVEETNRLLDLNETIVQGERDRYLLPDNEGNLQSIYDALEPLREIGRQIEEQNRINRENFENDIALMVYGIREESEADREILRLKERAKQELIRLGGEYPVLLDEDLLENTGVILPSIGPGMKNFSLFSKLLYGSREEIGEIVEVLSERRISDINTTREKLEEDPSRVFLLTEIINGTKEINGIIPGSIQDEIIQDKLSDLTLERAFRNVAIAALGITLGLLSGGTGTVAVLATIGSIAISSVQLAESIDQYIFESAASGTAFDKAQAISQNSPSPIWIALDIVGLVGDLAGALRIARAIGESAQAAKNAGATTDTMAQLSNDAGRIGRELAGEGLVRNADEVQEMAEAAVRRQLAQEQAIGDVNNAGALRAIDSVVDNLSDSQRFGLLQLPDAIRSRILTDLAPDIIRRIADASSQSASFRASLEILHNGLRSNEIFTSVLSNIGKQGRGTEFLRTISEVGVSADDLRRIDFSRVRTTQGYYTKFRDSVYDLMGNRISADLDNIEDITRVLGGMNPMQRRAILFRYLDRLKNSGQLPEALVDQIRASSDLQRVLQSHSLDTRQLLDWWNEFNRTAPDGDFIRFVEPRSGLQFSGRTNQNLTDFFRSIPENELDRNLALLNINEPRLANAIQSGSGLPDHLIRRLRNVLNIDGVRGAATTVNGATSKVRQALRQELAQNIRNPQELQQVMQLINEPGLRGSLGDAYFAARLSGPGTAAENLSQTRWSADDIPGLSVDPFKPDRIRPVSRRTLDIKAGYENTSINVEQLQNYNRLREQSQRAGSVVQNQLNELLDTPGGGGLRGHDTLFLPGPGGNAREAAAQALNLIESQGRDFSRFFSVYFQGPDGNIYRLLKRGGEFVTQQIGPRLGD